MNRLALACLLTSALAAQQDVLHYTFDNTDTTDVLNLARGPLAAPEFGTATWSPFYLYTAGRFGSALEASPYGGASGHYVRTGLQGGLQGAVTIAFFLKNGIASSAAQYSPIAGQPAWSIATGGSAGPGLQLTGWGGPNLNGNFVVPVSSMPGWNHFAIVVDPAAGAATWYHNGAAATTTPIGGGMVASSGELLVGTDWTTPCGSLYHIDEFVVMARAATPAEIHTMSLTVAPIAVPFATMPQGPTLQNLGDPALGNGSFALEVTTGAPSLFVLAAGFSYATSGALALPLDLGALLPGAGGQFLRVSPDATIAGALPKGVATIALPIPNQPLLLGANLFAQAFDFGGSAVAASNGLALRVGQ